MIKEKYLEKNELLPSDINLIIAIPSKAKDRKK